MIAASADLTRDPKRLAALCDLWRSAERDVWITLQGFSMMPTIPPGSRLRLHCLQRDFSVGDVIAFRRDGALIVHRLISLDEGISPEKRRLICQGDGNEEPDAPITPDLVAGQVVEVCLPPGRERIRPVIQYHFRRCRRAAGKLRDRLLQAR